MVGHVSIALGFGSQPMNQILKEVGDMHKVVAVGPTSNVSPSFARLFFFFWWGQFGDEY